MKIIWTFTLLMIPGAMTSMSVTGHAGGEINITCTYQEKYRANAKYFCRVQWSDCTDRIRTNIKNKWFDSGRFSLFDDTRAAVFTVTIRDLSAQDSGTYYCAADIRISKDSYTEVKLKIISVASCTVTSISVTGHSGGVVNITCKYDRKYTDNAKYFFSGSSLIIGLSVISVLLIIVLVLVIVALCKRHQAHSSDSASRMPEPGTENSEAVPQTGCIYEEIADTRPHTDPDTGTKTVYATTQLPINPSD
ncbi:CMRF35-like molecule 8 [Sinocyclocheilus grahami]|uniref:CMRF35-like molecule 8 n=1 Tax=Sinocyclocheilus grahami TaxID=75366 RepID=UPI0007AC6B95|nr:PREDICTED: CMRF35-like molecule 8 [Sinocyclocheilus grahami]